MLLKLKLYLTALTVFGSTALLAQKKTRVGANFNAEVSNGHYGTAGFGGSYEMKLKKHGGFETGIFYRTYKADLVVLFDPAFYATTIAERHLSIPILYKFYSRVVNFSVGPSFDFYVGFADKGKNSLFKVTSYSINPSFNVGILGKLSKNIKLTEKFDLEPELRINPILTTNRAYGGAGVSLKYKLK